MNQYVPFLSEQKQDIGTQWKFSYWEFFAKKGFYRYKKCIKNLGFDKNLTWEFSLGVPEHRAKQIDRERVSRPFGLTFCSDATQESSHSQSKMMRTSFSHMWWFGDMIVVYVVHSFVSGLMGEPPNNHITTWLILICIPTYLLASYCSAWLLCSSTGDWWFALLFQCRSSWLPCMIFGAEGANVFPGMHRTFLVWYDPIAMVGSMTTKKITWLRTLLRLLFVSSRSGRSCSSTTTARDSLVA